MKTLQITEANARRLYKDATPEFKATLEDTFGKEFFSRPVTERIDGWEDMLSETGRPYVPDFVDVPEDLRPFFKAVYKNVIMAEAYNEGEKMDIYDSDKWRHYPYFRTNGSPSAFAFGDADCDNGLADAGSGSRLSFKSSELAEHAGKKHKDIFREMLES